MILYVSLSKSLSLDSDVSCDIVCLTVKVGLTDSEVSCDKDNHNEVKSTCLVLCYHKACYDMKDLKHLKEPLIDLPS